MKKIFIVHLFLASLFNIHAQSSIKPLDPRKFESWTIEDQKYRIRIEEFINNQYRIMHPGDTLIADVKDNDKLIIVKSLLDNDISKQLYEIWYGEDGKYSIIPREKISWVFGTEFQKLILEKNYFYLESDVVFYNSEQGRIANTYPSINDIWTQRSLNISTQKIVAKIPQRPDLAVALNLSQPLSGFPKGVMRTIDVGLVLRLAEIGLRIPFSSYKFPIYDLNNSSFTSSVGDSLFHMNFGGYGKFNVVGLSGNLFVHHPISKNKEIENLNAFSDSIYVPVFNGNISTKVNIIKSTYQNPKSKLTFYPGFYFSRINKVKNDSENLNNIISYRLIDRANFYGRIDYTSLIQKGFPRIESFYQFMVGQSSLFSLTLNINKHFGIRLDHHTYQDEELKKILPEKVLDIGFRIKIDY